MSEQVNKIKIMDEIVNKEEKEFRELLMGWSPMNDMSIGQLKDIVRWCKASCNRVVREYDERLSKS